jgi:hypothetical protein
MTDMKKPILTLFILLAFAGSAWAATETFYWCVGGNGSAPEDGTCANAFDNADLLSAGNYAAIDSNDGKIGPNDEVLFMDEGGECTQCKIESQQSGLDGKNIVFKNYPGDTPVINAAAVYDTWTEEEEFVIDEDNSGNQLPVFQSDARTYIGQGDWVADADYVVSAMEFIVASETGTFDTNVVAEIYNESSSNLGTQPSGDCTSDNTYIDSTGTYKFEGMSCQLSNGNKYQLVFRRADSSFDASNYIGLYYDNVGDSWSGQMQGWLSNGNNSGKWATFEFGIKVYQKTGLYYEGYVGGAAGEPNQVFWDDSLMTEETVKANLGTGEWYNDATNDRVYVFDDPTSALVEGSYWAHAIHTKNKSYLTFDGLTIEKADGHNFWIDTYSGAFNDIVIQNCTIKQAFNNGLAAGIGGYGTTGEGISDDLQILNNSFSKNGIGGEAVSAATPYAIDIAGQSATDYLTNVVVRGNTTSGDYGGMKADWFGNDILFEYNFIDSDSTAFACDGCQNVTWKNNIVTTIDSDDGWAFSLFRWEGAPGPPYGFALTDNQILNNTIYGWENGINHRCGDRLQSIFYWRKYPCFYRNRS